MRTANAIDPATRTLLTEVDVPNPSGTLLPGAYAQVHFDAKLSGQRLTLPINALLFRPEGTMAAVVGSGQPHQLEESHHRAGFRLRASKCCKESRRKIPS